MEEVPEFGELEVEFEAGVAGGVFGVDVFGKAEFLSE